MPSSAASESFDLGATPSAVTAAVHQVIAENRHRDLEQSPDGLQIAFVTRKTMLSWELDAQVDIAPTGSGSHVELRVANVSGRPSALLDGKKNKKSVAKLADQIRAAVGQV